MKAYLDPHEYISHEKYEVCPHCKHHGVPKDAGYCDMCVDIMDVNTPYSYVGDYLHNSFERKEGSNDA